MVLYKYRGVLLFQQITSCKESTWYLPIIQ